jgi:hypothetical protein
MGRKAPRQWPVERGIADATCALVCASMLGCGGTQGGSPPEAGVTDAAQAIVAVGPSDPDPCLTSQQFEFQTLENFDTSPQLAGPNSAYVSYDGTGTLYTPSCSLGISCVENISFSDIYSTLCSNCSGSPDGGIGGCGGCSCTSGYNPPLTEIPPSARCGADRNALHLHADAPGGAGLTAWGMNVGIDLRQNCNTASLPDCSNAMTSNPPTGPAFFDAREWTGISFWALLGSGPSGTTALATVADPSTAGVLGGVYPFNDLVCGNGPCTPNTPPDNHCTSSSPTLCLCDPHGKGVGLVNHWAFYAIPFDDLRQKGYGAPEAALDLAHILNFTFGLGKGNWDVWIDDIAFYRPKGQ